MLSDLSQTNFHLLYFIHIFFFGSIYLSSFSGQPGNYHPHNVLLLLIQTHRDTDESQSFPILGSVSTIAPLGDTNTTPYTSLWTNYPTNCHSEQLVVLKYLFTKYSNISLNLVIF